MKIARAFVVVALVMLSGNGVRADVAEAPASPDAETLKAARDVRQRSQETRTVDLTAAAASR